MTLHLRPAQDNDPTRHTISRHCVCKPNVTVSLTTTPKVSAHLRFGPPQLIVQHKSDIPYSWAARVAKV